MSTHTEAEVAPAAGPPVPAPPPRPPLHRRLLSRLNQVWLPLLIVFGAIVLWELVVNVRDMDPSVLPAPTLIAESSWNDWENLRRASWVTFQEAVLGLSIAIVASLVIATVMDFIPWVRRGLYPILVSSQTIPIVAIAPLVIIWFGFGLMPKVYLVAFYTFFPIVVGLSQGLASTEQEAMALLRSMRASRWQIFIRARFPSALPMFFTGLRITVTYAVVAAVFAEYVGSFEGLGIYMQQMRNAFRTDLVFGAVVMTMILTLILFLIVIIAERIVMPWYFRARSRSESRW